MKPIAALLVCAICVAGTAACTESCATPAPMRIVKTNPYPPGGSGTHLGPAGAGLNSQLGSGLGSPGTSHVTLNSALGPTQTAQLGSTVPTDATPTETATAPDMIVKPPPPPPEEPAPDPDTPESDCD